MAVAVTAAGCGGQGPERLTVSAAASLRGVLPTIAPDARFNFAGSDTLAAQIREGAPVDVYVAAGTRYPAELAREGLIDAPITFASNRIVLIVPRRNPAGIAAVTDAARGGVRLVVAGAGVPVGEYTRQVLSNLGLEAALDNVVSIENDAGAVLAKVALGEADAGFVYATDAATTDAVRAIAISAAAQPPIAYQVAIVSGSRRREAAQAFIDQVTGRDGRAVLANAGFMLPDSDP